ncbi:sulfotransferase [Pectobacterium aroidearum]|uniref:sulfotransferase n=1 Tax=Pectobacterium aroidearum TaxID=1201031 RepID=UPI00211489A3|nr:sulfotransferase [Pectobacterium aroidearum]UUE55818.1 sulfotransferase [Pectobacterium aroidearum]UUE68478.1 sulfotransferase [Pectobacterium aroidearum]UUE72844.1 sulfotransferase [Pectobacterium aroidearum]UUE77187.1 sulfotransferase [Pectobacterium aroidearum]
MTDRSMTESVLAARWDGWLTCPQEHLHARMRDELAETPISEKTLAAMLAFVHEYRLNGVNWSAQGIRGDEVQDQLQGLQHDAPPYFALFCEKIALAEKYKWVGGSVDADVLAAQTRYQKFAIVSTPRAGTHLLRTLLGSHPNIEMHGEAFNRFGQHLLPYSVKDTAIEAILHRHLFKPYFEYVEAVGFVLFRDLDTTWGDAPIWPALQAIPNLKLILLERQSRLQQFVSLKKSLRDRIWYVGQHDSRPVSHDKIAVSPDELTAFIDNNLENQALFYQAFQHHDILSLDYETLMSAPDRVASTVLSFLGISDFRLCAGTGKKETRSIDTIVSNVDGLRTTLTGTKYESYL